MQRSVVDAEHTAAPRLHVAIIMDGNGRWASARGMPRAVGHRSGAEVVRRVVERAPSLGVGTLTVYAFSSDNWRRPPREVATLMQIFRTYLRSETARLVANGVRLSFIGRRDRLGSSLRAAMEAAEAATAHGQTLHLRAAIDYSSRDMILRAASLVRDADDVSRDAFSTLLGDAYGGGVPAPEVDLLIRTGGEQRLSDFLLWEMAYAELHFTDRMWPEFTPADLEAAIAEFRSRQRRFGAVPTAAAG